MSDAAARVPTGCPMTDAVIANPNDHAVWAAYSDYCRERGRDDWADLALRYMRETPEGRARLIVANWQDWPPANAITLQSLALFADKFKTAAENMARAFSAVGAAISRAFEPINAALAAAGRSTAQNERSNDSVDHTPA